MTNDWKKFLSERGATIIHEGVTFDNQIHSPPQWICPLAGCGIIAFSGNDAATFLQGQITCNINLVTETKSTLGAYCNPKGRTIIIFRAFKIGSTFYWLGPAQLLPAVIKRLKMYILRSEVQIQDVTERWRQIGISNLPKEFPAFGSATLKTPGENGETVVSGNVVVIKPSSFSERLMILAPEEQAKSLWLDMADSRKYQETNSVKWEEMDIRDGIPNLVNETSEQFIPQMLNLDLLDGIGLDKGCYTGQEIVARTHYLGKLKQRMFLTSCDCNQQIIPNAPIYDGDDQPHQSVGHVVSSVAQNKGSQIMLVVLRISSAGSARLRLQATECNNITVLELPYVF